MPVSQISDVYTPPAATWEPPEEIDAAALVSLGTLRRRSFFSMPRTGREFEVAGTLTAYELANKPRPNEVRVRRESVVRDQVFGKQRGPQRETTYIRAFEVEPGTYAGLVAAAEAAEAAKVAKAERATRLHLVDAADLLPVLDRQAEQTPIIAGGSGAPSSIAKLSARPARLIPRPSRDAVRGIEQVRAWIESRGVKLEAIGDHLIVRAARIDATTAEVVDTFRPLLVGLIAGEPVPCALDHGKRKAPDAWTLAVGRAPVCREHIEELGTTGAEGIR